MYELTNAMAEIMMMSRATKGFPIKWKKIFKKPTNKTGFVELVEIQRSYSELPRKRASREKTELTLLEHWKC